ncbi:MAG TPA: FKBP-type peptidyl-prolyl cis-trans isomerase [Chitinophagaceae bacterium]|nr:FKBP-type peptidyl-prolyl cis-trans isomerase [Chitinophagaceae bacterium]
MKLNSKLLVALMPVIMMGAACTNVGFEKTKTGMEYKIFDQGKGEKLKAGDIVKFNYRITYNDSVINESYNLIPGYDMVDSVGRPHDFSEILPMMKVGDSAVTIQYYDTLAKANPMGMPPYMKKGGKIKTTLLIAGVFKSRDSVMADYQAEIQKYTNKELAAIESYLKKNNITAEKVKNVFVEVKDKGTGEPAAAGKMVSVKYTGYNFEGKFFDSNIDSTKQLQKHGLEPFSFIAGQQGAIQGMLEGVTAFNKGGKGRLFIPSSMGYGVQGSPPAIKPNENLIFDIEVVDVQEAPQQPQMPQMPQPQGN